MFLDTVIVNSEASTISSFIYKSWDRCVPRVPHLIFSENSQSWIIIYSYKVFKLPSVKLKVVKVWPICS